MVIAYQEKVILSRNVSFFGAYNANMNMIIFGFSRSYGQVLWNDRTNFSCKIA